MEAIQGEIRSLGHALKNDEEPLLAKIGDCLMMALADHIRTTKFLLETLTEDRYTALGGSFDYMMQTGYLFGGWQLARSAKVAASICDFGEKGVFCQRKLATVAFYMERILPRARAHAGVIEASSSSLSEFAIDWF